LCALYAFRIGPGFGDWPMFCQNKFHQSYLEDGVEYVRWPVTEPKDFESSSNEWVPVTFVWCNKTIVSSAVAWKMYFFDGGGNENVTDVLVFYVDMEMQSAMTLKDTLEDAIKDSDCLKFLASFCYSFVSFHGCRIECLVVDEDSGF